MDAAKHASLVGSLAAAQELFKPTKPSSSASAAPPSLPPAASPEADKERLHALLERCKADASKVGILYSDGATPSGRDLDSLGESLVQSCLAVVNTLHAMTATAGPSLRDHLSKAATSIIAPNTELLNAMTKSGGTAAAAGEVKAAIGHCWGAVDACKVSPLDNKSSIFKNITAVLVSMKDGVREMTELQEESTRERMDEGDEGEAQEAGAGPHANGSSKSNGAVSAEADDGDDDIVDFEAGELSVSEVRTLAGARQLVEAAGKVLRAVSKPLVRGPAVTAETGLEAWENVLWHARALQKCCEDLGASMYPPQDVDEVTGAAEGVFNSATLLLTEIPEDYAEQLSAEAASLEAQLESANQQLLAALQAAGAGAGEN